MNGPLEGITIVELGTMIAIPAATALLAAQGAQIIKVENTAAGDDLRHYGSSKGRISGWFANANAGKRSVGLDITNEIGRDLLLDLMDTADVFAQGMRPGVADRLGVGWETAQARNPGLVYVSGSGFGPDGPYADRPVYDPVIQAMSGWAAGQRNTAGHPTLIRSMVADKVAALTVAQAITAALVARASHGRGQHVEVSMLEANLAFTWPDMAMHATLLDPDHTARPNLLGSYQLFECADGWISVTAGNDAQWAALCDACERPELVERFATAADRAADFAAFYATIAELVAPWPRQELIERAVARQVPIAPVYEIEEIPDDPQVRARGAIEERQHPTMGRYRAPRQGARFSFDPAPVTRPAPGHAEHTDEVMAEMGLDPERVAELRAAGVLA